MSMPSARSLHRTALHEAGHAVMMLAERREFETVVIARTERSSGMVTGPRLMSGDDEQVRVVLAGIVAHRLSVRTWHPSLFNRAADDLEAAAAFYRGHAAPRASIQWNVGQVQRVLVERWAGVEAIAEVLIRERELTFEQVSQVATAAHHVRRVPPGRTPPSCWSRLVDCVESQVKYPGGLAALLRDTNPAR